MLVGDADDKGALAMQNLRLDGDFGQFGGLIVHELALVRRLSPARRADPCLVAAVEWLSRFSTGVTVIGPPSAVIFGEKTPDLAQQGDLLGIGLDLALQAVEQIEQPAPILGRPQELRKRHERLHRLEVDDVGLLADDFAGGLRRHVEKTDVLADELAGPFHGREPPPPGAGLHQQERRTDDGFRPVAFLDMRQRLLDQRSIRARRWALPQTVSFSSAAMPMLAGP